MTSLLIQRWDLKNFCHCICCGGLTRDWGEGCTWLTGALDMCLVLHASLRLAGLALEPEGGGSWHPWPSAAIIHTRERQLPAR